MEKALYACDELAGFVCGFLSQTEPHEAYIHFVGVAPERRGEGLGLFFPVGNNLVQAWFISM